MQLVCDVTTYFFLIQVIDTHMTALGDSIATSADAVLTADVVDIVMTDAVMATDNLPSGLPDPPVNVPLA